MSKQLLDLPRELRDQVWCDVLTSSTGYITPLRPGKRGLERGGVELWQFHYHSVEIKPGVRTHINNSKERIFLSVLCTSKQIKDECENLFWQKNTFVLQRDSFFLELLHKIDISNSAFRKITSIQLDIEYAWTRSNCKERIHNALETMEKLAENGSLNILSVKTTSCFDSFGGLVIATSAGLGLTDDAVEGVNPWKNLAKVKKTVLVGMAGWDSLTAQAQRTWLQWYLHLGPADRLQNLVADIGDELWVDERLCFENVEGKPEVRGDLFPLKALGGNGEDGTDIKGVFIWNENN